MAAVWTDSIKDDIDTIEDFILDTIHSDCEELDEMCRYVIQSGGKRVRPIVCLLTYLALGGQDKQRAISVGSAFEIVHSATLIHDDINDGGEFRRGRRTLHREYTLTKAIVAGDYLLTRGYKAIGNNLSEEAMAIVAKAAAAMSEGEFMQQDLERDVNVTEAEYFKIINGKTAVLINAAAMAGALLVSRDRELLSIIDEYAIKIGLAFQIIDDALDVVGSDKTGKKVGIDMTEGKPTLPVIYAIEDPKYGKEIAGLFARKDLSDEEIARALDLIKRTDSIDRCRKKADQIVDEAVETIRKLPESPYRDSLEGLALYIASRDR